MVTSSLSRTATSRPVRHLLLDANLLVLLVVGLKDRALISKHRRTQEFTVGDYDLLLGIVSNYDRILVTPNVLTEGSNLLRFSSEPVSTELMELLRTLIDNAEERYVPSKSAACSSDFPRLGLTDVALIETVGDDVPLLTADLDLYLAVARRYPNSVTNFSHLRSVFS